MDNASETTITRTSQAAATAGPTILQTIARAIPNSGPAILSAPLFKAGKAPTKYAHVTDTSQHEVVEFKQVVVTARHTHKAIVKVSFVKEAKQKESAPLPDSGNAALSAAINMTVSGKFEVDVEDAETQFKKSELKPPPPAPHVDVKLDWSNSLASVVSIDPLFDTTSPESTPAAVFCVIFLCATKDAKPDGTTAAITDASPASPGGADSSSPTDNKQQTKTALASMMTKRSAYEWALLSLRRQSETPLSKADADHVKQLFQLGKPSVRARAYLVPDSIGGAAQRDEWVSVYRAAVQNYWQERLESCVIPAPEVFQWCSWAQFAGPSHDPASSQAGQALPPQAFCLIVLSTQKLYLIHAGDGNLLSIAPTSVPGTAVRSAEVGAITSIGALDTSGLPYGVQVECASRPFGCFHFFSAQHAAEFLLETQRVFEMVRGEEAAFPVLQGK